MARPLRIEYPGACYHVMNRGNRGDTVFRDARDHERFLEKLDAAAVTYEVRVRAYCLMPNHFHCYLQTLQPNLSRFMQAFLTAVTVASNRRHCTSGHFFQGRYKAFLVEDERYRSRVSRYIHLNPVETERARELPFEERRELLLRYPWSSYRAYIGQAKAPEWLDRKPVLSTWGTTQRARMEAYRSYVEQGLLKRLENPLADAQEQCLLGSEDWIDRIRREYLLLRDPDNREDLALRRIQRSIDPQIVIDAVCRHFAIDADALLARRSPHRLPRRLLQYLLCQWCIARESLSALAERLHISVSAISLAHHRFAEELPNNTHLRQHLKALEQTMITQAEAAENHQSA